MCANNKKVTITINLLGRNDAEFLRINRKKSGEYNLYDAFHATLIQISRSSSLSLSLFLKFHLLFKMLRRPFRADRFARFSPSHATRKIWKTPTLCDENGCLKCTLRQQRLPAFVEHCLLICVCLRTQTMSRVWFYSDVTRWRFGTCLFFGRCRYREWHYGDDLRTRWLSIWAQDWCCFQGNSWNFSKNINFDSRVIDFLNKVPTGNSTD